MTLENLNILHDNRKIKPKEQFLIESKKKPQSKSCW